jgi:hypothetical protein
MREVALHEMTMGGKWLGSNFVPMKSPVELFETPGYRLIAP